MTEDTPDIHRLAMEFQFWFSDRAEFRRFGNHVLETYGWDVLERVIDESFLALTLQSGSSDATLKALADASPGHFDAISINVSASPFDDD
jgi:hypothetical protein